MNSFGTLEQIRVEIKLTPTLEQFRDSSGKERRKLELYLSECLNDLLIDLAIPFAAAITISMSREELTSSLYQIELNGQWCRCKYSKPEIEITARELARQITNTCIENRNLILSTKLVQRIQDEWSKKKSVFTTAIPYPEFAP